VSLASHPTAGVLPRLDRRRQGADGTTGLVNAAGVCVVGVLYTGESQERPSCSGGRTQRAEEPGYATRTHGKGGVTVPGRIPRSLETYRKHRPPLARDPQTQWEAAEQAWQRGVRRAMLLTVLVPLLTLLLVDVLPLVLVSG